jgi:uncharacterized low-complexity protein
MSEKNNLKPVAAAIGAAFAGSMLISTGANAAANPFGLTELDGGYMQVAEGKCGGSKPAAEPAEGKCGGAAATTEAKPATEGKCGEGKCGGTAEEPAAKPAAEGKCGEGKCGAK